MLGLGVLARRLLQVRELRLDLREAQRELVRERLGPSPVLVGLRERLARPRAGGCRRTLRRASSGSTRGDPGTRRGSRPATRASARRGTPSRPRVRKESREPPPESERGDLPRRRADVLRELGPRRGRPRRRASPGPRPRRGGPSRALRRGAPAASRSRRCGRPGARPAPRAASRSGGGRCEASVSFSFSSAAARASVAVAVFVSRSSRIPPSGLKTQARRTAYVAQKRTMMRSRERSGSVIFGPSSVFARASRELEERPRKRRGRRPGNARWRALYLTAPPAGQTAGDCRLRPFGASARLR